MGPISGQGYDQKRNADYLEFSGYLEPVLFLNTFHSVNSAPDN
jgi:hypothetical protein